ncbi:hypothetical protein [Nitrobacter sp. TKz-YC02]|uniref:hypothetical protein n=1 Tax=Nitrobacter sp. TKz-YC02 TaxID=3398704 RepID=UPI003CE8B66C
MRDIRDDLRERLAAIQSAFNAAVDENEAQIVAIQAAYRQKVDAFERERQAVLQLLRIEEERSQPAEVKEGQSVARQPALPLSEFILTKLHAQGPMTKDQIRAEVDRAGYFDGEATGRTLHLTLMNISGSGGRVCRLIDGRYACQTKAGHQTLFGPTQSINGDASHALM